MSEHLLLGKWETPIGELLVVVDDKSCLRAVDWTEHLERMHRLLRRYWGQYQLREAPLPASLARAFEAYFAGEISALEGLPVTTRGTEFQRQVWAALRTIEPGQTVSYAGLSARLDRPKAVRAVGAANGSNPVGLVIPCHRVVGSDGSLTGYGGGMERKRWLLEHESGTR